MQANEIKMEIQIGRKQTLEIVKKVDFGFYLNGNEEGEILLPAKYVANNKVEIGDSIEVFVYLDTEDRLIATTENPILQVGEMGVLEIVDVANFGAFAHWGLIKDLFIPPNEQITNLRVGDKALVRVYLDKKGKRLAGTTKIEKYLIPAGSEIKYNSKVNAIVFAETDLGFKCAVNYKYNGLLYKNEIYGIDIEIGDAIEVRIKNVRPDGKIDLNLNAAGYENKITENVKTVLACLHTKNGFLNLNDNSTPEAIYEQLQMSKKSFKQTVGFLFKKGKIILAEEGIYLADHKQ